MDGCPPTFLRWLQRSGGLSAPWEALLSVCSASCLPIRLLSCSLLNVLGGVAIGIAATLITVKISDSVSDAIQGEVMGVQMSLRVLGDALICLFGGVLLVLSPKLILFVAAALSAGSHGILCPKIEKGLGEKNSLPHFSKKCHKDGHV